MNILHPVGKTHTVAISLLITAMVILLSGCTTTARHHHSDHHSATALSFEYHYFPGVHVYYDVHRKLYHYHHKHRGWISVKVLPRHIRIRGKRHHVLRSRHHQPWKNKHLHKHHRSHFDDVKPHHRREDRREHKQDRHERRKQRHEH